MSPRYPGSKVEIQGFSAKHYDGLLDVLSLDRYGSLIEKCIGLMGISPGDRILDLGAGTGRNACLMRKHLGPEGRLVAVDISREMLLQFRRRCGRFPHAWGVQASIDQSFPLSGEFDKVFISFVLHGFPQEVREVIVRNSFQILKPKGKLFILDYNEFSYKETPFYLKVPFKLMECPYAFDFIGRDWKGILTTHGFGDLKEHLFFKDYIRLLGAQKG